MDSTLSGRNGTDSERTEVLALPGLGVLDR